MALSASGSSGARRQNSAYSLTGIGDTSRCLVLGWNTDFSDYHGFKEIPFYAIDTAAVRPYNLWPFEFLNDV